MESKKELDELRKFMATPEYKEYSNAGAKVLEALSGYGVIIDIKVDDCNSNVCRYIVEFETGYKKDTCIKHKKLIEDEIIKQPPFNGKGHLFGGGMTYYKFGKFWEWSFTVCK